MSNHLFQKSIAITLGMAIASTGLLYTMSSQAQGGATAPSKDSTIMSPSKSTGSMGKPVISTPQNGGMSQSGTAPAKRVTKKTIVDVAMSDKRFSTLVKALKAADLVDTLSGEGPFTVFAPTNDAFAKLPKGTLQKLLKPENKEQLKKILTYHVVSGAIMSKTLKSGDVHSVEGSNIKIKVSKAGVMVNNARVIKADVETSNGVIHVINSVIMPAPVAAAK